MSEANQEPRVGSSHEISAPDGSVSQIAGTFASKMALMASRICGVMMMAPSIANEVSDSVLRTSPITLNKELFLNGA